VMSDEQQGAQLLAAASVAIALLFWWLVFW
jgi:hypothetical protein